MKLLIELSEEDYFGIKDPDRLTAYWANIRAKEAIRNGTPIPDNATNGDVIKAMFGGMQINDPENENDLVYVERSYFGFPKYWWNAPYKGVSK